MTRTNPYKKKQHQANKTLLIHGEGLEDCVFLKYLKSLYAHNTHVACKISRGNGGSADSIVLEAYKVPGAYDKRVVVLDNDKTKSEMLIARQLAKQKHIELIEHTPCLEAFLLSVLNSGKDFTLKTSSVCKKEFESRYISTRKRSDETMYYKLFPKQLLDKQRSRIKELNTLIRLFENI